MKKIILSIVTLMVVFIMVPLVKAEEKVSVYMFSKDGCSACISAQSYFAELAEENPDLFELVELQVFDAEWNFVSEDLQNLLIKTYERFGEDTSKAATPTIVIGDYHTIGLPQDTSIVYNAIVDAKEDKKEDEIQKIANELGINIEDIKQDQDTETVLRNNGGKYDAIIVISIFVVLIGGFAALVVTAKK